MQQSSAFQNGISQFGTKIDRKDREVVSAFKSHLDTMPEDERNLFTMTRIAALKNKVCSRK
jgi:hypothetical protein